MTTALKAEIGSLAEDAWHSFGDKSEEAAHSKKQRLNRNSIENQPEKTFCFIIV